MATTLVPLEVYLQTEYDPAAEYVDGVIEAGTFSRFEDGQLHRRERFSSAQHGIEFELSEIARLVE